LCPALRKDECTCAANLKAHRAQLDDPNAVKFTCGTGMVLTRVHPGGVEYVEVPDPVRPGRMMEKPVTKGPRWVCGACGWACRGTDPDHKCDLGAVRVAQAREALHFAVPVEKRYSGGYVLAMYRNIDGLYMLKEMVLEGDRVLAENVLGEQETWDVHLGKLVSESVERFTP
jgi:hypothetical protein